MKGELRANPNPEKIVVLTFSSYRNSPKSATNHLYEATISFLMDDNNVVRQWQEFQLTASPELQRYFKMELDIQNRLDQAADDIQEQDKIDNTNLDQLQWQQAAGMRPVEEHCSSIRTSSNGNVPN